MINIDTNIAIVLATIFGILILCLIGMISSFLFMMRGDRPKKAEVSEVKLQKEAESKSLKVLEDAHKKAREILSNAKAFSERSEGLLEKELKSASAEYTDIYKTVIKGLELEAVKSIHNMPKDIKLLVNEAGKSYEDVLSEASERVLEKMESSINQVVADYRKSLDSEKELRKKELDDKLKSVVKKVIEDVLGKSISDTEHEKLILASIEQARREGIFGDS